MHGAVKIATIVLGLIALYLVLVHGDSFNKILKTAMSETTKGVEVLQGRGETVAK